MLVCRQYQYQTGSDCEVILSLYREMRADSDFDSLIYKGEDALHARISKMLEELNGILPSPFTMPNVMSFSSPATLSVLFLFILVMIRMESAGGKRVEGSGRSVRPLRAIPPGPLLL